MKHWISRPCVPCLAPDQQGLPRCLGSHGRSLSRDTGSLQAATQQLESQGTISCGVKQSGTTRRRVDLLAQWIEQLGNRVPLEPVAASAAPHSSLSYRHIKTNGKEEKQ